MNRESHSHAPHSKRPLVNGRSSFTLRILVPFLALFLVSVPGAVALQASSSTNSQGLSQAGAAPVAPALSETLQPALNQVESALRQVQIDRWKLSRDWKAQMQNNASSIQQDLATQLPALFQTAQKSPAALEPQWNVMHNVNALYDVLVRIQTAADIAGGKNDAATIGNAVHALESARRSAASQLLHLAAQQDRQVVEFQTAMKEQSVESSKEHPKTIVVDNRVTHRKTTHRTTTRGKESPSAAKKNGASPSSSRSTGP